MSTRVVRKTWSSVPGGEFAMGCDRFYPEEAPVRRVHVDGFWMDEHPVTVAEFRRFVKETGYVTVAEHAPDPRQYPGADPELLVPGSLVFHKTRGPVDLRDMQPLVGAGARCRAGGTPKGPGRNTGGRDRHPVVHVAYEDAAAYAAWAGKAARRPRPSGSLRRAAGWRARRTPGARSSRPGAS